MCTGRVGWVTPWSILDSFARTQCVNGFNHFTLHFLVIIAIKCFAATRDICSSKTVLYWIIMQAGQSIYDSRIIWCDMCSTREFFYLCRNKCHPRNGINYQPAYMATWSGIFTPGLVSLALTQDWINERSGFVYFQTEYKASDAAFKKHKCLCFVARTR